jgi:alcohol dehydrogenase
MTPFDFQPRTRFVFGEDKIDMLGQLAVELGTNRALVVSDPGIVAAGHTQRGIDSLTAAGVDALPHDHVRENPTTAEVESGRAVAADYQPDLIVGLGGGSSMDCAKGINFLHTNGGQMKDYWGRDKAAKPMLPMIAVPTTAGTGSEAQSFALISDPDTHAKMACGDKKATCRIAILDPRLTLTQPPRVAALTGVDALSHALETYVTKARTAISSAISLSAWRLIAANFGRVLDSPDDLEARGGMQMGACLAGLAIENSMLGAAHALANPVTARYDVAHGQAVGIMLPHVIRFNGEQFASWYRELLGACGDIADAPSPDAGPDGLAEFVIDLVAKSGLATRLADCNVDRDRLPQLAADAATQWTGTFNPRPVGQSDLLAIYEQAY